MSWSRLAVESVTRTRGDDRADSLGRRKLFGRALAGLEARVEAIHDEPVARQPETRRVGGAATSPQERLANMLLLTMNCIPPFDMPSGTS